MRESEGTCYFFFFSSRRRHTRLQGDWSFDVCSSDLPRSRLSLHPVGNSERSAGRLRSRRSDRCHVKQHPALEFARVPRVPPVEFLEVIARRSGKAELVAYEIIEYGSGVAAD